MGCKQSKVVPSKAVVGEHARVSSNNQSPSHAVGTAPIDLTPSDTEAFASSVSEQRHAAIENMTYREAIDKWRPSSTEELAGLVEKLSTGRNQIDRAWIIFYWISQNIVYDTTAFFNNQIGAQDADAIFQSKRAVCEGYATLFADLCARTGIQCRKVSGYAKAFGFDVRQTKFGEPDHAWNIMTLDNGHCYFVESTWGSGHLDSATNQYKASLAPHYFMCPPEHMIYGHLPEDASCQLLAHPITSNQYIMLPHAYSTFFTLGLQILSPANSSKVDLVANQSYGQVLIRAPNRNVQLSGALQDETGTKIEGGEYLRADKDDPTLWLCHFAPPKPGKYDIIIFARREEAAKLSYSIAVQYGFDVARLPASPISYPAISPSFFDYQLEIVKPVNSRFIDWSSHTTELYGEILVRSPDNVNVSLTLTDTASGALVKDGTLTNFNRDTKLWQCLFAPPSSGIPYEMNVFAKYSHDKKSVGTATFNLRPVAKQDLKQAMVFPETYGKFGSNKCQLFEPLSGVLRSGSTVHFRCRVPGAQEVNITSNGIRILDDGLKPDENGIFESDILVGQKDLCVLMKTNATDKSLDSLLKYTVN